jgi:hypothetical protein
MLRWAKAHKIFEFRNGLQEPALCMYSGYNIIHFKTGTGLSGNLHILVMILFNISYI